MEHTNSSPNTYLLYYFSIAFHFRYSILDGEADIKALLHGIIQKLNTLAYTYKMAVIVTNQMTTQILQPTTGKILPLGTIYYVGTGLYFSDKPIHHFSIQFLINLTQKLLFPEPTHQNSDEKRYSF